MIVLAIDSAMNGCGVGIYDTEKGGLAVKILELARGQAEHLMPMVENVLNEANKTYDDIELIGVTNGPGAFTGMRIGIATAKSLGLVLDIPVIGISTFDAIFNTYMQRAKHIKMPFYGVILETKRQDFYFQMYDLNTMAPCQDSMSASAQEIISTMDGRKYLLLGDAVARYIGEIKSSIVDNAFDIKMPDPLVVASLSMVKYQNNNKFIECDPVYLRAPEIGVAKTPIRKLKK